MSESMVTLSMQTSLMAEAERIAAELGTTLNQLINLAVAEKIAALRKVDYIIARGKRGQVGHALELLQRAGNDAPPQVGDEIE